MKHLYLILLFLYASCGLYGQQASSNSPVCLGKTLTLTASGGTKYQWSGPNGFSSTLQNPVIEKTTLASSGVYYVTIDGKITYLNVIVGQEDLSGRTPISQTVVGGGLYFETYFNRYIDGLSYEWTGANNFTSNDVFAVVKGITKKSEGMYRLKIKDKYNCIVQDSISVKFSKPDCLYENIVKLKFGEKAFDDRGYINADINKSGTTLINICEGSKPQLFVDTTNFASSDQVSWYKNGQKISSFASIYVSETASYYAIIKTKDCEYTTNSFAVKTVESFTVSYNYDRSSTPIKLCKNDGKVTLYSSVYNQDVYDTQTWKIQWFKNDEPLVGQNWYDLTVKEPGVYRYTLSDGLCSGTSAKQEVILSDNVLSDLYAFAGGPNYYGKEFLICNNYPSFVGVSFLAQGNASFFKDGVLQNKLEVNGNAHIIKYNEVGTYTLEVKQGGCISRDTLIVKQGKQSVTAINVMDTIDPFACLYKRSNRTMYINSYFPNENEWTLQWYRNDTLVWGGYWAKNLTQKGLYRFKAMNNINGCVVYSDTITLNDIKMESVDSDFENKGVIHLCKGTSYPMIDPRCASTDLKKVWKKDGKIIDNSKIVGCKLLISEAGKYWIEYTDMFCTYATDTLVVEIDKAQNVPIQVACVSQGQYSLEIPIQTNSKYLWYKNDILMKVASLPKITVSGANAAKYQVQILNDYCSVMSMPTAIGLDVPSKLSVCHGSSLSIPKISNFKDFKWVGPNGFTATQNDIVIPNVNDSHAGVYTVTINNGNTCVASATVTVDVNQPLDMHYPTSFTVCENGEFIFPKPQSALSQNFENVEYYQVKGPHNLDLNNRYSYTNPIIINKFTAAQQGEYLITGFSNNTICTTTLKTTVTISPSECRQVVLDQDVLSNLTSSPPCYGTKLTIPFKVLGNVPASTTFKVLSEEGKVIGQGTNPIEITVPQIKGQVHIWIESEDGTLKSTPKYINVRYGPGEYNTYPVINLLSDGEEVTHNNYIGCDTLHLRAAYTQTNLVQWYLNDTLITGATSLNYEVTKAGIYKVVEKMPSGCMWESESVSVKLKTLSKPYIEGSQIISCDYTTLNIKSNVRRAFSARYEWIKVGDSISENGGSEFKAKESGLYQVKMKLNSCESISDTFEVKKNTTKELSILTSLEQNELSAFYNCNKPEHTLRVNNPNVFYSYQWYKNDEIITNATASSLVLNETGNYHVRVKFGDCFGISEKTAYLNKPFELPVYDATTNNDSTNNYSLCKGDLAMLSFNISGNGFWNPTSSKLIGYSQIWYKDGVEIYRSENENGVTTEKTSLVAPSRIDGTNYTFGVARLAEPGKYQALLKLKYSDDKTCSMLSKVVTIGIVNELSAFQFNDSDEALVTYSIPKNQTFLTSCASQIHPFAKIGGLDTQMRPYQYEVFRNGVKVKTAFDKDSVKGFSTNQEGIYHLKISHKSGCVMTTGPITIKLNKLKTDIVGIDSSLCQDQLINLRANVNNNTIDSKLLSYSWVKNNQVIGTSPNLFTQSEGVYQLKVELKTANGVCQGVSDKLNITKTRFLSSILPKDSMSYCGIDKVLFQANNELGLSYQWEKNNEEIPNATSFAYQATQTGRYRVLVQKNGCYEYSPSVFVGLYANIPATASISGDQSIDYGKEAKLKVDLGSHAPWTFKLSDGREFTAQKTPFEITVNPLSTTSYTLSEVKNICGTGTVSGTAKVTVLVLGIEEESGIHVEVYPVPASDYLTWKVRTDKPASYDLRLSDTQGRVLEVQHNTSRSQAHEGQLNISTLPAGVYFLQMTVGDKTFSRKVIKE